MAEEKARNEEKEGEKERRAGEKEEGEEGWIGIKRCEKVELISKGRSCDGVDE